MKRRMLSILCVLCLVVAMLPPVTASAAPTTLIVGGANVQSGGYWKTAESGTLTAEGASADNYNVHYDGNGTLTLKDATINGTNTIGHVGAGIYAEGDLTIVLEGSSTVTGVQDPNGDSQSIRVSENLTIQGGGSLTAQGADTSNGSSYGIFVIGSFTQQGGSVTASGGDVSGSYNSTGLYVFGSSVTVQGGTLKATGGATDSGSYGISMFSSVTVGNAAVTATGGTGKYSYGLYIDSSSPSVTLSDNGSLTARSESADKAGGIYFQNPFGSAGSVTIGENSTLLTNSVIWYDNSFKAKPLAPTGDGSWLIYGQSDQPSAVGGTYTLEENITIESGNTLTIPAGGTLTVPTGITLTVNGTLNIANQSSLTGSGTLNGSGNFYLTNPEPVISGSNTLTYDGTDHFNEFTLTAPSEAVQVMGKDFAISDDATTEGWSLDTQVIKDAGNYTLTAKNSDGSRTVQKQVTVSKATSTIAFNNYTPGKTYDGTALANPTESELTLTGAGYDDVTFTWYKGTSPNGTKLDSAPADAGTYYLVASIPDSNNTTASEATSGEITITKATATAAPGTLSVSNNAAKTYTYDLSQLLPALDDGKTLGEVTYALGTVSLGSYYDNSSPATISGSTLTLPIQAVDSSEEKEIGTVAVTISSGNYADMTGTITLSSVNKLPQTVTISGHPGSVVYGDSFTLSASAPGSGAVSWSASGCASVDSNGKVTITGTGEFTITAAVAEDGIYTAGTGRITMTVGKKALTITAENKSAYVGDSAPALTYTVTGLVGSDTLTTAPTLSYASTPDMSKAGTVQILASGAEAGDNYDIQYVSGTLTVTTRPSSSGGTTTPSGPSTGGSDGWTEIEDEVDETPSGGTVTVDMNGTTEVPAEVLEAVAGKDVTLELDMGGGVKWEINGQDIPTDLDFTDLDLGVSLNTSDIPVDVINMVTGEKSTVQLSLAHDGEFGFTLTLTAPVGTENKGLWANLYHYNTTKKQMLFETAAQVDSSGNVALKFTHASEYAIVLDESSHELPFTDTAKGAWYQGAVEYVYRNSIMTGTSATSFEPNALLSRAMVAQILYNLEGQPTVEGESTFADASGHWAVNAIAWAQQTGVVNGYEDNTFRPNRAVSREELAQMLYNYAKVKGYDLTASGDLTAFPDGSKVSSWAQAAMKWATGLGVINGYEDNTLRPGGSTTRAEAASMILGMATTLMK